MVFYSFKVKTKIEIEIKKVFEKQKFCLKSIKFKDKY